MVLGLAQQADVLVDLADEEPAHQQGQPQPAGGDAEQRWRQPGQVGEGGDAEDQAVGQLRQVDEGDGDVADVAGQAGEDARATDLLQALDIGIQHPAHQAAAQAVDEAVAEGVQRHLPCPGTQQQRRQQAEEAQQRGGQLAFQADQLEVDEGDHADAEHRAAQAEQNDAGERQAVVAEQQLEQFHGGSRTAEIRLPRVRGGCGSDSGRHAGGNAPGSARR